MKTSRRVEPPAYEPGPTCLNISMQVDEAVAKKRASGLAAATLNH
jgi:hypothetical protein